MRQQLINRMIEIYGFEHDIVTAFCDVCETFPRTEAYEKALRALVESHEEYAAVED